MTRIAVLEVGGTHTAASWVETHGWQLVSGSHHVTALRADGSASELLDRFAECLHTLGPLGDAPLAVAVPGPFDYDAGIGRFRDVGKFDALAGVDVGAGLGDRLDSAPHRIAFVNDAAAFGLGEWLRVGDGRRRVVAITLGTGVGSAFVDAGALVSTGAEVPPEGHVYRLTIDGRPLESVVSRRAIVARYQAAADGSSRLDVQEIAARADDGDEVARQSFVDPIRQLGAALAPWLDRFSAQLLVVGGGISRSWPLVRDALRDGVNEASSTASAIPIEQSRDPETATALGAAWHAVGGVRS